MEAISFAIKRTCAAIFERPAEKGSRNIASIAGAKRKRGRDDDNDNVQSHEPASKRTRSSHPRGDSTQQAGENHSALLTEDQQLPSKVEAKAPQSKPGSSPPWLVIEGEPAMNVEPCIRMMLENGEGEQRAALFMTQELFDAMMGSVLYKRDMELEHRRGKAQKAMLHTFKYQAQHEMWRLGEEYEELCQAEGCELEIERNKREKSDLQKKYNAASKEEAEIDKWLADMKNLAESWRDHVQELLHDVLDERGLLRKASDLPSGEAGDVFIEEWKVPESILLRKPLRPARPGFNYPPQRSRRSRDARTEARQTYWQRRDELLVAQKKFHERKEKQIAPSVELFGSELDLVRLQYNMNLTRELIEAEDNMAEAKAKALALGTNIANSQLTSGFPEDRDDGQYMSGVDISRQGPEGKPRVAEWAEQLPEFVDISSNAVEAPETDEWPFEEVKLEDSISLVDEGRSKERILRYQKECEALRETDFEI